MASKRALLVLALLTLAPAWPAEAAPPLAQPWSASVPVAAASLAFDDAGSVVLVGGAGARSPTGAPTSSIDLAQVLFDAGNVSANTANQSALAGSGKEALAISGDGKYALGGGAFVGNSVVGPNVFYYALPDLTPVWRLTKAEPVTVVAANRDGTILAVGTSGVGAGPGHITLVAGSGATRWEVSASACGATSGNASAVRAMDLSSDGRWLVVGTALNTTSGPQGCVLLFDSSNSGSLAPVATQLLPSEATAVDITPSGLWYTVGTAAGHFFAFANSPGIANPEGNQLNAQQAVRAVRVSGDGSAVVVADNATLNRYLLRNSSLQLQWSAPVGGIRSLDMTTDGDYIVVGAAQVVAFHRSANATLWSIDTANALVKVAEPAANDVRIVTASGSAVKGYKLHWAFDVRKAEPEPIVLTADQARPVALTIVNTGSGADNFDLSVSATGFQVGLDPGQLALLPGQEGNATITLTPEPAAQAGFYRIGVAVRGVRSGSEGEATINATLGAVPRLSLSLLDTGQRDRQVFQGDEINVQVLVRNDGNARLDLAYDLTQAPNIGGPWEANLSRTSGLVERGVSTNTLSVRVPAEARNGTENFFTVTARGEGVEANLTLRMVVNPTFTAAIDVIPQSKVVAPGKSVAYDVVVANNGTLRETYRLAYCLARVREEQPLVPCVGNQTQGLGGWGVALDTSPFTLERNQSRSFHMTVAAPRGALPRVDKLALQVEVVSTNPLHLIRDVKVVITSVVEDTPTPPPPRTPGFEPLLLLAAAGLALAFRRRA